MPSRGVGGDALKQQSQRMAATQYGPGLSLAPRPLSSEPRCRANIAITKNYMKENMLILSFFVLQMICLNAEAGALNMRADAAAMLLTDSSIR